MGNIFNNDFIQMIKQGVCGPLWELVFRSTLGDRWGDLIQWTLCLMEKNLSGFPWDSYRVKPPCSLTPSPVWLPWSSSLWGYTLILASGFHKNRNSSLSDSANDYFAGKVVVKPVKHSCHLPSQPHQHPAFFSAFYVPTVPLQKR